MQQALDLLGDEGDSIVGGEKHCDPGHGIAVPGNGICVRTAWWRCNRGLIGLRIHDRCAHIWEMRIIAFYPLPRRPT